MTEETANVKVLVIAGTQFNLTPKYAEGHVLSANEAAALNQTFYENVNNNMRKVVKEGLDPNAENPKTIEQLQAEITEYADKYEFGAGRSTSNSVVRDPVDKAAIRIAEKIVKQHLKDKGKTPDDLTDAQWDQAVSIIATNPNVRTQAEAEVEAAKLAREATAALAKTALADVEI